MQIAGEVPDFDELAWVEKRERKHVSRVLPLALAAATEALQTSGIDAASLPLEEKRRFGVILGSGGGSQEFTEEQYRLFFHQQYRQMSLFCVPTGVMGSLSSELSVRFGLRGPSHIVTTGCTSSTDGFAYSIRQIQSGRLDMTLSGGADAPIALGIVKGFILMKILTDSWNHAPEGARVRFQSTAMALWWPREPGCSSSKNTNMPAPAARKSLLKYPATARLARLFIAYVCRNVARNLPAPLAWR